MEQVFKAIAEPVRRDILDALRARDGRTIGDLEEALGVSRFVVMKHVKTLEEARLVTTERRGRHRLVFINAEPIQAIAERWIAPIVRPYAHRVAELKAALEQEPPQEQPMSAAATTPETTPETMPETGTFRLETFIRTTPERLWRAITDRADTVNYYFGSAVESDWAEGSEVMYRWPDGKDMLSGTIKEIDPPRRLVTTFRPHWREGAAESLVTYSIEQVGDVCRLLIVHEQISPEDGGVREGWARIISGLKTWIETGEALPVGPMG